MITRIALIALVTSLFAGCSSPASPNKKIVGTWECIAITKSVQQTYSKDGTYLMIVAPGGSSQAGTWSIDDDRLTVAFPGTEIPNVTDKILKLDSSVLVYEATNRHGALITTTWKRVK